MGTPERDDEGQWQPIPSQAEGDTEERDDPQWQPTHEQPAEGGRDQVDEP